MAVLAPRRLWLAVALGSGGAGILTIVLTEAFRLDPCYLCIFERLLMLILAAFALLAAIWNRRVPSLVTGSIAAVIASLGIWAAAYQSWLQLAPQGTATCSSGNPGVVEQLVDWLGTRMPSLFLATGFCEDDGMVMLGLTLANWATLAFLGCLVAAAAALWLTARNPR